jgi:enoyl-CoA hydratase
MAFTSILTEKRGRVGLITLNRLQALNALNAVLLTELTEALTIFDTDNGIGAMVITGSERAFAAGADIKEMADASVKDMMARGFVELFDGIRKINKPVIAAVSGFALGGGCELALSCDMIVASETAKFGLPEVMLGVIPGAGGTQRLTHALGKSLAMEVILNNRTLSAAEAQQFGLVNRVVPVERFLDEALALAEEVAARAPVAVRHAKQAVNVSY